MREIEYKAWHKLENRMIDPVIEIDLTKGAQRICWYETMQDAMSGCITDENMSNVELLQYTGLRDRNSVEICKGDIVKFPVEINKERHGEYALYEIVKRNGQWFISYLISEKGSVLPKEYLFGLLLQHFDYNVPDLFAKSEYYPETKLEVIGNIYENPELLEV